MKSVLPFVILYLQFDVFASPVYSVQSFWYSINHMTLRFPSNFFSSPLRITISLPSFLFWFSLLPPTPFSPSSFSDPQSGPPNRRSCLRAFSGQRTFGRFVARQAPAGSFPAFLPAAVRWLSLLPLDHSCSSTTRHPLQPSELRFEIFAATNLDAACAPLDLLLISHYKARGCLLSMCVSLPARLHIRFQGGMRPFKKLAVAPLWLSRRCLRLSARALFLPASWPPLRLPMALPSIRSSCLAFFFFCSLLYSFPSFSYSHSSFYSSLCFLF